MACVGTVAKLCTSASFTGIHRSLPTSAKCSVRSGNDQCYSSSFVSGGSIRAASSSCFGGIGGLDSSFSGKPAVFPIGRSTLIVRAGGTAMACTKRSASRKKRARVHGFRARMKTKDGQNVLRRRRQKGRLELCTQSFSPTGKEA
eukprot:TRINITY_DN421_c0_g1_i2.p1 TRINITY_DN421_c0_g1~~TRINITY_DN421_c0_g1_i2.p1  ORF type:complete len:154 (+),score=28.96 TRINITY_DN421_c0_g1_i2:29-463(+)